MKEIEEILQKDEITEEEAKILREHFAQRVEELRKTRQYIKHRSDRIKTEE